ncbi:MAG: aminoglycoside phosphotransferase family protein [Planctomycetota bacterium]|nr:aminoglycoside phosphotransferase family protein [Planctomycetota bacterium]
MPHANDSVPKQASETAFDADVWQLLEQAGFPKCADVQTLTGGANNRAYRVSHDGCVVLLKLYFHHPDDPRDRCRTEFAFSEFAATLGLTCMPRPLAVDHPCHAALFEFIEGLPISKDELTAGHVADAAKFIQQLNASRSDAFAHSLPTASEACFRISDHVDCVNVRVQRLNQVPVDASTPNLQPVLSQLFESWTRIRADILATVKRHPHLDETVASQDRVISPSDFGFHNAIRQASGEIKFIDFEYAGWDDPAKLICDFFEQPKVSVPATYRDAFTSSVLELTSNADWHIRRIEVLRDAYAVKWCCILLNEFLPTGRMRRSFSRRQSGGVSRLNQSLGLVNQKLEQLAKMQQRRIL